MKEEPLTDASLRQFLLGNVRDEERQRIESLFLTDALSRDRVVAAEEDLLEDYLEDSLSAADKERFQAQYAHTLAQQRRLRITKSFRDWAIAEGRRNTPPKSATSGLIRFFARLRLRPMFVMPMAVTALIAIVVVALWLNRKMELRNQQLNLEQEIAKVNALSSVGGVSAQVSIALRPVSLRGMESQTELVVRPDMQIVELRLLWNQQDSYRTYEALLHRVVDSQSFRIRDLHSEADGKAIRVRLPAHILNRGLYQVELTGMAADGRIGPSEEYQFEVAK